MCVNAVHQSPIIMRCGMLKNVVIGNEIFNSHLANLFALVPKCEKHEMTNEGGGNEIQTVVFGDEVFAIIGDEQSAIPIWKSPQHFIVLHVLNAGSTGWVRDGANRAAWTRYRVFS